MINCAFSLIWILITIVLSYLIFMAFIYSFQVSWVLWSKKCLYYVQGEEIRCWTRYLWLLLYTVAYADRLKMTSSPKRNVGNSKSVQKCETETKQVAVFRIAHAAWDRVAWHTSDRSNTPWPLFQQELVNVSGCGAPQRHGGYITFHIPFALNLTKMMFRFP